MEIKRTKFPKKKCVFRQSKTEKIHKKEPPKNEFLEYWNSLENVRKHKNIQSKIYKNSARFVKILLFEGLGNYEFDREWIKKFNIQERFLKTPWPKEIFFFSIYTINEMCKVGNWPGENSWLSKMSLENIIYNPITSTSILTLARCRGKATSQKEGIAEINLTEAQNMFFQLFKDSRTPISSYLVPLLHKTYNNLYNERPIVRHLCPSFLAFGRVLFDWLSERNITSTSALKPTEGWLWQKFEKETFDV